MMPIWYSFVAELESSAGYPTLPTDLHLEGWIILIFVKSSQSSRGQESAAKLLKLLDESWRRFNDCKAYRASGIYSAAPRETVPEWVGCLTHSYLSMRIIRLKDDDAQCSGITITQYSSNMSSLFSVRWIRKGTQWRSTKSMPDENLVPWRVLRTVGFYCMNLLLTISLSNSW